jgi:hypothetical protein
MAIEAISLDMPRPSDAGRHLRTSLSRRRPA